MAQYTSKKKQQKNRRKNYYEHFLHKQYILWFLVNFLKLIKDSLFFIFWGRLFQASAALKSNEFNPMLFFIRGTLIVCPRLELYTIGSSSNLHCVICGPILWILLNTSITICCRLYVWMLKLLDNAIISHRNKTNCYI